MVKVATKNIIKETKKMELGTAKQIQNSRIKKASHLMSFNHCQNSVNFFRFWKRPLSSEDKSEISIYQKTYLP